MVAALALMGFIVFEAPQEAPRQTRLVGTLPMALEMLTPMSFSKREDGLHVQDPVVNPSLDRLGMSGDQKAGVVAISVDFRRKCKRYYTLKTEREGVAPAASDAAFDDFMLSELTDALAGILSDSQMRSLLQHNVRACGPFAFTEIHIQKLLTLDTMQMARVAEMKNRLDEEIMASVRAPVTERGESRAGVRQIREKYLKEMRLLLTQNQNSAYMELIGRETD